MKAKMIVIALLVGISVTGCWDNEKERRASEFMSTLTKCDDCKLDKPLIGGKKEVDQ